MSGYPQNPPMPPMAHAPVDRPQTSWPKVLGIIMIIFGAFGSIGSLFGLFAWPLMKAAAKMMGSPELMDSPLIQRWMLLTTVFAALGLALAILLLSSGIGLIKRRAWAVKWSMTWAGLKIVLAVANVLANSIMVQKIAQAVEAGAIEGEAAQKFASGGSLAGMLPGLVWSCALPVFLLIWLSRRNIKEETREWA